MALGTSTLLMNHSQTLIAIIVSCSVAGVAVIAIGICLTVIVVCFRKHSKKEKLQLDIFSTK